MYQAFRMFKCMAVILLAVSHAYGQTGSLQDLASQVAPQSSGTTIYVAREFITMDPKKPKVEAVAVKDGRFVAVGSRPELEAMYGKNAKVDSTFADKVVSAGFVEQHVHPVLAALTMNTKVISIEDWDAIDGFSPAVRDPQGYEQRLKAAVEVHRKSPNRDKPLITWGYHHYMHGDGMSRQLLNKLAPDFPVIVWHRSCHELFFNDAALKLVAIDEALVKALPKSAREQVNWEKAHFFEQGMMAILGKIAPVMATKEQFINGLQFSKQYYHRNGITVCCEPGGMPSKPIQDLINSVYSDNSTPFNHYFMADGKTYAVKHRNSPQEMVKESESILNWGSGRTAFLPKQVKLFTDGAIFSQLMMMKDGYSDGHHGAWIIDPELFSYAFQGYWDAGYQIHIHNNGDAGFDVVLGELMKAMKRAPRQNHRTVLVHFGFAQADQVKKWINLGGIVSSNPYYVTALAGPYEKIGLGPERAKNIAPHKYVLDNKGSLSFHSDMPMAPAKPLQLVWAGVNRFTYEGPVAGPEHRVPLDIALKAITIDAAYSIQLEKEVGSIEVGKKANLTVLKSSPYDVAPEKLKDIAVWGTMLEGRVHPIQTNSASAAKAENRGSIRVNLREPVESARDFGERQSRQRSNAIGSLFGNELNTRISSVCKPGCSCSISHLFGALVVQQMEQKKGNR